MTQNLQTRSPATGPALVVSASRTIGADPAVLYALVADVASTGTRSPETYDAAWLSGSGEAGSTFRGRNRIGFLRWSTVATVTEAVPGRVFAFTTSAPSNSRWTYRFEEVDGGTRVVESMEKDDRQPAPIRWMQRLVGVTDRAEHLRTGMTTTLERLDAAATRTTES